MTKKKKTLGPYSIEIEEATTSAIGAGTSLSQAIRNQWYRFQLQGDTPEGLAMQSAWTDYFSIYDYQFINPEVLIKRGYQLDPEILYQVGLEPSTDFDDNWTGGVESYPTHVIRGKGGQIGKTHKSDSWVGTNGADDFPNESMTLGPYEFKKKWSSKTLFEDERSNEKFNQTKHQWVKNKKSGEIYYITKGYYEKNRSKYAKPGSKEIRHAQQELSKDSDPKQDTQKEGVPKFVDELRAKYPGAEINVFDKSKQFDIPLLEIDTILIPKDRRSKGIGSNIMKDIIGYADQNGLTVRLKQDPSTGGGKDTKAAKQRLTDFYKQFGFVENKGRNRRDDISFGNTGGNGMYRLPKKQEKPIEQVSKPKSKDGYLDKRTNFEEEAKKYDDAESFIKSQPSFYHGTNEKFKKFDLSKSYDKAAWFVADKNKITSGEAGASLKPGKKINIIERFPKPGLKLATPEMEDKLVSDQLIQQGYRGVFYPGKDYGGSDNIKLWYPEEDTVTSKELEKIYNSSVTKKPQPKEKSAVENHPWDKAWANDDEGPFDEYDVGLDPMTWKLITQDGQYIVYQDPSKNIWTYDTKNMSTAMSKGDVHNILSDAEKEELASNDIEDLHPAEQQKRAFEKSAIKKYQALKKTGFEKISGIELSNEPELLGSGQEGVAFRLSDGRVLKIASTEGAKDEAETASYIMEKGNIYGANRVSGVYHHKGTNDFYIISDYAPADEERTGEALAEIAQDLSDEIETLMREDNKIANFVQKNKIPYKDIKKLLLFGNVVADIFQTHEQPIMELVGIAHKRGYVSDPAFQIISGLHDLYVNGIRYDDPRADNYGWNGDKILLIDFGRSKVEKKAPGATIFEATDDWRKKWKDRLNKMSFLKAKEPELKPKPELEDEANLPEYVIKKPESISFNISDLEEYKGDSESIEFVLDYASEDDEYRADVEDRMQTFTSAIQQAYNDIKEYDPYIRTDNIIDLNFKFDELIPSDISEWFPVLFDISATDDGDIVTISIDQNGKIEIEGDTSNISDKTQELLDKLK